MARPQRNNVDYFPLYCEEGKKMYYLEETYGNDGFAVFLKLLRELAKADYHYLNLSENTTVMFLSAKCKVNKETLLAIINDLVELKKFDAVLWNENNIIWCQDFIDSIQDAYTKRINDCITYKGLLNLLEGLGVRKPPKGNLKPPKGKSTVPGNTQTILEDSKEEKRKENIYSDEIKNFTESIIKYFPIPPKKIESWFDVTEKLVRINNYQLIDIEIIVKWFRADQFWKDNFQSYTKLRKKKDEGLYIDYFANIIKNGTNKKVSGKSNATAEGIFNVISELPDQDRI